MYIKIACLSDQHIPFLNDRSHGAIMNFLKAFKPNKIKLLGDVIDLWQISHFLKDPCRINTLQEDLDKTQTYIRELRDGFLKAEITMLCGNHEDRLRKYLWERAYEISPIRELRVDKLLGIDEMKIKFYPEQTDVDREGEILFTHGTVISQESGMTARRMLKKYGMSIVHGHTHRLGSHYKTMMGGSYAAFENGCLCKSELAREWRMGMPDWQNGITLVFIKGRRFICKQLFISKGQLLYGEEEYNYEEKRKTR